MLGPGNAAYVADPPNKSLSPFFPSPAQSKHCQRQNKCCFSAGWTKCLSLFLVGVRTDRILKIAYVSFLPKRVQFSMGIFHQKAQEWVKNQTKVPKIHQKRWSIVLLRESTEYTRVDSLSRQVLKFGPLNWSD